MKRLSAYTDKALAVAMTSCLATALCFTSCTNDDSTEATKDPGNISISGIDKDGYTAVSYCGNYLDIKPIVESSFDKSELKYEWLLYKNSDITDLNDTHYDVYHGTGKDFNIGKMELISTSQDLHYEVNLQPEAYTLALRVTAPNGIQTHEKTSLQTTTTLSDGYYILKETADGNTDFDMCMDGDKAMSENIISAVRGEPMKGKPLAMGVAFNHSYTDSNGQFKACNLVSATTGSGDFKAFSTNDFSEIFDRNNMLYGGNLADDEIPYGFSSGVFCIYFTTSNGLRSQLSASAFGAGSGLYGDCSIKGGSRFYLGSDYCTVVWNEYSHSFYYSDYLGHTFKTDIAYPEFKCIDCGRNSSAQAFFIMENNAGARKLITISMAVTGASLASDVDLLPDSHIGKATDFTVCYSGASFIYCLDGNKIYTYNLVNGEETELSFSGFDPNEKISYISCNAYGYAKNMRLIIGTQNDKQYTLRFYPMIGGKPDGNPDITCRGTGYVKSVRHTSISQTNSTEQD